MKIGQTMSSNRIKQNILANAPSMKINTLNTEHTNKLLYQIRFFKHPVPRHIIVNVFSLYWLAISFLALSLCDAMLARLDISADHIKMIQVPNVM